VNGEDRGGFSGEINQKYNKNHTGENLYPAFFPLARGENLGEGEYQDLIIQMW
jgi:hypothetical protein